MYDVTGHSQYTSTGGAGGGGGGGAGGPFTSNQAEETFRQFFGGDFGGFDISNMFGGAQNSSSGEQLALNLSFEEAVQGCTKDISMRVQETCSRCKGRGGEPGTKEQMCPYCRGRGEVRGSLTPSCFSYV